MRWHRFMSVAASSRSAQELLTVELDRPVTARAISNHVLTADQPLPPLQLAAGELPVRILEHLLLDSRPPHRPLAVSSAMLVAARLPSTVRGRARRGEDTLAILLEQAGLHWTAETRRVEQLTAATAAYRTELPDDVPTIRITRHVYLLGTPVALVIEDIPLPEPTPDPTGSRPTPTPRPAPSTPSR